MNIEVLHSNNSKHLRRAITKEIEEYVAELKKRK